MFDEPTSALDQSTESRIMASIHAWLRGKEQTRTSVFIAHRLATIADCDVIYVVDGGGIVETGAHEELLKKGGAYAHMWKAQSRTK